MYNFSDAILQKTDEQLEKHLYNSLKHKTYLVLLDDIRDIAAWDDLKHLIANYHNGSRIRLTSRNMDVAPSPPHRLNAMSDEDTLTLLGNRIFYSEPGHPHLGDIAKDITLSCRGFPCAVVIVGNLLSGARPIGEYWEMVLSSINTSDNYDNLVEELVSLTYMHLPQRLKVCLLHMAIFPYNDLIHTLKLTTLWIIERFVESEQEVFEMLLMRGLLVGFMKDRDQWTLTWAIADEVFHDFLVRKAKDEKFYLVINKDTSYDLQREDSTYNQQCRLCIQQNIHHFIKDKPKNSSNSSVRCLLYSGPKHQYPLSAWLEDFKLLEMLDAIKTKFYTFPPEIFKLFPLRYLSLSCNRQLPMAVCSLQNLQVLVVSRYLNLKNSGVPSYLPADIWKLNNLFQLCVTGSDLPEPPPGAEPLLCNLRLLSHVSARSCTQNIFEKTIHIGTLEVQIESSPWEEPLSFFSYLDILNHLKTFECVVVYPDIGSQVVPCSIPTFPLRLSFLTLSGCGFPWEYMTAIASLPELEYLKLQMCAFRGDKWEVMTNEFPNLQYLFLEDMDFEKWSITSSTSSSFPMLEYLIIRHCYKLTYPISI